MLIEQDLPDMQRVVIGVDPSGTAGKDRDRLTANDIGIVAVGLGVDGYGYVLGDYTCNLSPNEWGRRVITAYDRFQADRIVAERNYGGAMVEHVIRTVNPTVSLKMVIASRGKVTRAEPVAALFEQDKIRMVGSFPQLEDELVAFTQEGYVGGGSPNRADALVWAVTDLMLNPLKYLPAMELSVPM